MENEICDQPNVSRLTATISKNINSIIADKKIDLSEISVISTLPLERLENIASGTAQYISLSEIVAIAHALGISETQLLG